jgi:uncharacterized protein YutE (UPF0331/DUF86 family)
MDDTIILSKLDSLQRCIERIEKKTPASADLLKEDIDTQDIVAVNLERAVQACVDVAARMLALKNSPPPDSMADSFACLHRMGLIPERLAEHMVKAVGFRNIAVHAYKQINWSIVYSLITTRLVDFRAFARHVLSVNL